MLSLFIPIVLALGESVSMQALTLTLQAMADGPDRVVAPVRRIVEGIQDRDVTRYSAAVVVVGLVVFAWRGQMPVASAIFVAISLSMIIACLLGVAIPAILRAAKADPGIAAGPVVLAAADVVTLLLYFGIRRAAPGIAGKGGAQFFRATPDATCPAPACPARARRTARAASCVTG